MHHSDAAWISLPINSRHLAPRRPSNRLVDVVAFRAEPRRPPQRTPAAKSSSSPLLCPPSRPSVWGIIGPGPGSLIFGPGPRALAQPLTFKPTLPIVAFDLHTLRTSPTPGHTLELTASLQTPLLRILRALYPLESRLQRPYRRDCRESSMVQTSDSPLTWRKQHARRNWTARAS